MLNFITLFDKNYLSRGITLYDSLVKYCDDFLLFILAMDAETEDFLITKQFDKVEIISLTQIESYYPELQQIKTRRTHGEYCWTLTSYCIQYAIQAHNLDACTYVDADILFYNNPRILIDEADNNSVIITEHHYTLEYDQTKTSGKYCVQFMYFKNDADGQEVLEWWRQQCEEWCYARQENGKFGDQKYLDDWLSRFKHVYVPSHIGCGLAPWNIQQYDLDVDNGFVFVQDKITKIRQPLIFFHFHGLKVTYKDSEKIIYRLSPGYEINETIKEVLYKEYVNKLIGADKHDSTIIVGKSYRLSRPTFLSVSRLVIKNIIKSFLIIKRYNYYKKLMTERYNQDKTNFFIKYFSQ